MTLIVNFHVVVLHGIHLSQGKHMYLFLALKFMTVVLHKI